MARSISRRALFEIWLQSSKGSRVDALTAYVVQKLGSIADSETAVNRLKTKLKKFSQEASNKWEKGRREHQRVLRSNASWLQMNITFPEDVFTPVPGTSGPPVRRGRPTKPYSACGPKAKALKVQHLLQSTSEELGMAMEIRLRKEGKRDSASIVKELSTASPNRGTVIKKARRSVPQKPESLSPEQALALMVDTNLSTRQYHRIREQAQLLKCRLYPPYHRVKEAKGLCYPQGIIVTETSAEIPLQSLIDHTVSRLCQIEGVREKLRLYKDSPHQVIMKWGCDGSEQNRYKQRFSAEHFSDESLFSISVIPLQIFFASEDSETVLIWKNPNPSSTRYCRPIKFLFAKESADLVITEVARVQHQINTLTPTRVGLGSAEITITPTLIFCMVDGKVCNAVSSCTSTQTCYLCGAKPSEMNNVNVISGKEVTKEYLSFGISPLHSWIRLFECILHISYRLDIETWQARGSENKQKVARKKRKVQERFRRELGLLVDMPKQQGGNTNDGNTARKFFRNPDKAAEITGVNVDLIRRLGVILECINCDRKIHLDRFDEYTVKTRDLYLQLYSWYPMPVSLHKILFHGRDIIEVCILPIGQYSEEAQEARNKHNRQYRELFTRKTSRLDTNTDLLNRLLVTSDPYIAGLRASPRTKPRQLNRELIQLLEVDESALLERDDSANSSEDSSDASSILSETECEFP